MSKVLIVGDSNALGEWGTIIPDPELLTIMTPKYSVHGIKKNT